MKNHQFIHISTVKLPPMDNQEYGWIYITDNPLGPKEPRIHAIFTSPPEIARCTMSLWYPYWSSLTVLANFKNHKQEVSVKNTNIIMKMQEKANLQWRLSNCECLSWYFLSSFLLGIIMSILRVHTVKMLVFFTLYMWRAFTLLSPKNCTKKKCQGFQCPYWRREDQIATFSNLPDKTFNINEK